MVYNCVFVLRIQLVGIVSLLVSHISFSIPLSKYIYSDIVIYFKMSTHFTTGVHFDTAYSQYECSVHLMITVGHLQFYYAFRNGSKWNLKNQWKSIKLVEWKTEFQQPCRSCTICNTFSIKVFLSKREIEVSKRALHTTLLITC